MREANEKLVDESRERDREISLLEKNYDRKIKLLEKNCDDADAVEQNLREQLCELSKQHDKDVCLLSFSLVIWGRNTQLLFVF